MTPLLFTGLGRAPPLVGEPHLVDEHDGEDGLVEEPGFPAATEETWRVSRGRGEGMGAGEDICLNMWPERGHSVTPAKWVTVQHKFNSREAEDSFHDDVDLGPLASADGNTCRLERTNNNHH